MTEGDCNQAKKRVKSAYSGGLMQPADTPKIHILSDLNAHKTISETLMRVYPGATISQIKEANLSKTNADLVIIDTQNTTKEKLSGIIGSLTETPVLLIVPDLNQLKTYRQFLSGRREIITKDEISGSPLIHAVHHLRERQQLHEKLIKAAHRLKDLSIRDELTRFYNHHYFNEVLTQEVKKANRYKRPLGLAIVDLKNFSQINKSFGHHEGDRILSKTADIIRTTIREVDIGARYGDNVFAIILPESDMSAAIRAGERLTDALSSITAMHVDESVKVSVCIGVAALGNGVETKEDILKTALGALAESKKNGILCAGGESKQGKHELKENRQLIDQLSEKFSTISRETERGAFQSMLKILSDVPFQKKYLIAHAERVAFFSERLAAKVEPINGYAQTIHRAGLLHDIGKLAIDADILNKGEKLSAGELALIKTHTNIGAEIVGHVPFLSNEADIILHHHERYDGGGYPAGLKGEDIPLGSRIIALTESWDAMISPQPYRTNPCSLDEALGEIQKGAGKQFDPSLVETFIALITG